MPEPGDVCPVCLSDILGRSPLTHFIECDLCSAYWDDREEDPDGDTWMDEYSDLDHCDPVRDERAFRELGI